MRPGDQARTWKAFSYVTVGEATGQSQGLIDQVNNGPIRLRLPCAPSTDATDCTTSGDTTMSVNAWRANNGSGPVEFSMVAKDGDGWGANAENISRYTTGWFMEWVGGTTVETPGVQVRCDYGPEMTGPSSKTGCVFPAGRHHMERITLADPFVTQAAHHIYDALYTPNATQPPSSKPFIAKVIPGLEANNAPLTRLWQPGGQKNKANHEKARRTCISLLGQKEYQRLVDNGEQCDEYPFASTYQGAASGGDFSVRMIDGTDNRIAGDEYLNHWYNAWRILDGDAFFVDAPFDLP